MRTRFILPALAAALAVSASAAGCQIIAGLTTLDVTGGTGGGSSASSSSSSSSSSSASSGTGGPPCTPGMPCGGDCVNNMPFPMGTCTDAGTCPGQGTACTPDSFCAPGPMPGQASMCVPCGTFPMMSHSTCPQDATCPVCDQDAGACVTTCDAGVACGTANKITLLAMDHNVKLVCNGQGECDNLTVECQGAYRCDVDCEGGCVGLKLKCAQGPCKLKCGDMSCMNATMMCGFAECSAECNQMVPIVQDNCGGSMCCKKTGLCK